MPSLAEGQRLIEWHEAIHGATLLAPACWTYLHLVHADLLECPQVPRIIASIELVHPRGEVDVNSPGRIPGRKHYP